MKMLINGEWVDRDARINVCNPYNNEVIDTVPAASAGDVGLAIDAAEKGFQIARKMPVHKRMEILNKVASIVLENREDFARTIATEGSKTIKEARKEAYRCWNTLSLSAEEARRTLGETIPFDSALGAENKVGYYYRFPIGIIACITPFNDPLNLVAHKIGPAIAGGNAVVLKPATVTPLSALKLGESFMEAGLPGGILNIITGKGGEIGDALVTDPRIRMVSFTGGTEAGKHIVKIAGLKKIGMELGSNSPVIVMNDCDIEQAVESSVSGAFWAVGQNCIGVQRIYIHSGIYDEFEKRFVERTNRMKTGFQLDEDTDMGPMITEQEAVRVESWIKEAVDKGAKLLTGGKRNGSIVHPTVLSNVPSGVKMDCEEVFGPVVNLYKVNDIDEAIRKSNSVNFGLHGAIFTKDINTAYKAIHDLEVGSVIVNDSTDYRLDQMPFGGVKNSGLGREGVKFSLMEMTEPKVVCFNL